MNEKSSKNLFRALLIIGAAIIITGAVIRIFFGLLGHVVIGLGIIVGVIALCNYINNLNDTIAELKEKLNRKERENK